MAAATNLPKKFVHKFYIVCLPKRFNYGGRESQRESVRERQHTDLRDQQILVGIHRELTLLMSSVEAQWPKYNCLLTF